MKTLCLFTNEFPYGNWEPYLETEVNYYSKFDEVIIFALQLREDHANIIRQMPNNVKIIAVRYAPRWIYFLNSVMVLTDKNLYRELDTLKKSNRLGLRQIIDLFVYLSRSHYEARQILKKVPADKLMNAMFYCYRFEYQPYVVKLIKKKLGADGKIVSRAHRYDLYEEFRKNEYIPMREILLENIDYVFPCSQDGCDYLAKKYPEFKSKIKPKFLGTVDHGVQKYRFEKTVRIVSCSNVVTVKRLNLIVQALSRISDIDIEWTHFGDGALLEEIKKLAEILPNNVRSNFRGNVKNSDLLKIYAEEQFLLFLNVSKSEGIPVSIMEALSFGIPCIATDVGGTKEIIIDGVNGILLRADCTTADVVDAIRLVASASQERYLEYRNAARLSWETKYDADCNYRSFVSEILKL